MTRRTFPPASVGSIELHTLGILWPPDEGDYWQVRGPGGRKLARVYGAAYGDAYGRALAILGCRRPFGASRVLFLLREGWDHGDRWGSAMMAAGAVCDVATVAGELDSIPDGLQYRPGVGLLSLTLDDLATGDLADSYEVATLAAAYIAGEITGADLDLAARILDRYLDVLRAAGEDY